MRRLLFLALLPFSLAQDSTDTPDDGLPSDPYLAWQPEFARSLPIQILITGIILTLACILLLNLLFTLQYHWPLARLNYALQVSGVVGMLLCLVLSFNVILTTAANKSREWPYMLDYVAVEIPPDNWGTVSIACWYVLEAVVAGIVHITHIQFLTLLYPSTLEAKLIISLLGPLALFSSFVELLPIYPSPSIYIKDIADTIRNICNSTLSLLFAIALILWGFVINRKQAWRSDGGTGAFGGATLMLAVTGTSLNFLSVSNKGPYLWLPGLLRSVVLWQSFVGWWWWIGAGMAAGLEFEEALELKRRRQLRANGTASKDESSADRKSRKSSTKDEARSTATDNRLMKLLWRSHRASPAPHTPADGPEDVHEDEESHSDDSESQAPVSPSQASPDATLPSSTTASSSDPDQKQSFISSFYQTLRRAHLNAVRLQTLEWLSVRRERGWRVWMRAQEYPPSVEEIEMSTRNGGGDGKGTGVNWWGPVGKWRLRDRTRY
ncbi:hypothetical protein SISNIDRAFT_528646 [Sistotremastrum niveocremeum HHB9708]|uniref:Family A G protein-coupled receptor-like protein n=1 Tax=Sistotremastrum niveocremeum HHB9708 TaxID=1314777 RepID=A0A164PN15_9AGAM|nr:hypothetical protein SISNIDRAFT_528646 [Sistotremastrum niveocremeum HHB9708]